MCSMILVRLSRRDSIICFTILSLLLLTFNVAGAANAHLKKYTFAAAGARDLASSQYHMGFTAGDVATATGSSENYGINEGYWHIGGGGNPPPSCWVAGDANHDGGANVGDAVFIINFVFKGGPATPYPDEGDANADCGVNVGDSVFLINFVFKGGPSPVCGCAG